MEEEKGPELQVDWNEGFQTLVAQPDSLEKFTELTRLAKEFVYLAETYGRIIIAESYLEPEKRTIKPADLGSFLLLFCLFSASLLLFLPPYLSFNCLC